MWTSKKERRTGYANIMVYGQREVFEENLKDIRAERRSSLVVQWVKDLALSLVWLELLLWREFDSWPGNFPMTRVHPKKKKKERKNCREKSCIQPDCGQSQHEAEVLNSSKQEPLKAQEAKAEEMCHKIPGTEEFSQEKRDQCFGIRKEAECIMQQSRLFFKLS